VPTRRNRKVSVSRKETGVSSIGMLIIGMIAGAVLMAVFNGLPESVPGNVGSGLKNLVERSQSNTESSEQVAGDAAEDQPGDQVEFDFYEVLPDVGRVMMDDFPVPDAERASNSRKVVYMIQAASLRKESDAEALRARLALADITRDKLHRRTDCGHEPPSASRCARWSRE
jgi:hypothetical protein